MKPLLVTLALLAGCTSGSPGARPTATPTATSGTATAIVPVTSSPAAMPSLATPRERLAAAVGALRAQPSLSVVFELREPGQHDPEWFASGQLDLLSGTTYATVSIARDGGRTRTARSCYVGDGKVWVEIPEARRASYGGAVWSATTLSGVSVVVDPMRLLDVVALAPTVTEDGTAPSADGTLRRYRMVLPALASFGIASVDAYVDPLGRLHTLRAKRGAADVRATFTLTTYHQVHTPPPGSVTHDAPDAAGLLRAAGLA